MAVFPGEYVGSKMLFVRSVFSLRACSLYSSPKRHSGKQTKKVLWSNKPCVLSVSLGGVPARQYGKGSEKPHDQETCVPLTNPVFLAFDQGGTPPFLFSM